MDEKAKGLNSSYCVFAIPLLVETGCRSFVDRILVVDCPEQAQLQRVKYRDNLAPEITARIMASQASRAERLAVADDVIQNGGGLAELRESVTALHRRYSELVRAGTPRRTID
jgi:dephospho-CoA kinase